MQRETPKRNFAARVGMWSARQRKTAIIGWFTFVLLAFALGNGLGIKELDQTKAGAASRVGPPSYGQNWPQQDDKAMNRSSSRAIQVGPGVDSKFRAAVADVTRAQGHAARGQRQVSLRAGNGPTQISKDGRSVRVDFEIPGKDKVTQEKNIDQSIETVAALQKSHSDLRVEQFGMASADKALNEALGKDFQKAEKLSLRSPW